jgi:hypothetical protein
MKILSLFLVILILVQCAPPPDTRPPVQEELNLDDLSGATVGYGGMYQFFDQAGTVPSPYQDGSHSTVPWYLLEPTVGNYDWSDLEDWITDRRS